MVDHAPPTIKASYDKASLWDQNKCPLYGIAGYPLLRGFEYIEVYGNTIRTFKIVRYIAGVRYAGFHCIISDSVITMLCLYYAQFTQPYTQLEPRKQSPGKLWSPSVSVPDSQPDDQTAAV